MAERWGGVGVKVVQVGERVVGEDEEGRGHCYLAAVLLKTAKGSQHKFC